MINTSEWQEIKRKNEKEKFSRSSFLTSTLSTSADKEPSGLPCKAASFCSFHLPPKKSMSRKSVIYAAFPIKSEAKLGIRNENSKMSSGLTIENFQNEKGMEASK
ncbi:hypothetical protein E2542_SST24874 [Spatholobus suberectus]|nr:hypothetical protein E2542_SST24874 [Spatholobus suberectus]